MNISSVGFSKIENRNASLNISQFINLARQVGPIIPSPNGNIYETLKCRENGPPGTYSSEYGKGLFPFHTDGAYMQVPPRFILLWCEGDYRRKTYVRNLGQTLAELGSYIYDAKFVVRRRTGHFYTSPRTVRMRRTIWRWDSHCMSPLGARSSAAVGQIMNSLEGADSGNSVDWLDASVVLIDNWNFSHARGTAPPDERARVIHRIYIGESNVLEEG